MSNEQTDVEEMSPGERLDLLLVEQRMTQTALAEACGRTPQYVNNIVRRGQRITEGFAQELAEKLDVNLNWLFSGKGQMFREEVTPQEPAKEIPEDFDTSDVEAHILHASEHLIEAADELEDKES